MFETTRALRTCLEARGGAPGGWACVLTTR
jgi:hypothetical protein